MSSTTLVAFTVTLPLAATFVNILGSWDNFRKPCPLRRDPRIGKNVWRGCHSYEDIICDGEHLEASGNGRDGGLLMGGTYWYYYQVDDDVEFCDPAQPATRSCPFLPGQEVNVLEVPVQSGHRRSSGGSTASSTQYALNPEDKYAPPQPSSKDSELPSLRPCSFRAPELKQPASLVSSPHSRPETPKGILKFFSKAPKRPYTRDEDGNVPSICICPDDRPVSRLGFDCARPGTSPASEKRPSWLSLFPPRNMWSAGDTHNLVSRPFPSGFQKQTSMVSETSVAQEPEPPVKLAESMDEDTNGDKGTRRSYGCDGADDLTYEPELGKSQDTVMPHLLSAPAQTLSQKSSSSWLDIGTTADDSFMSSFVKLDLLSEARPMHDAASQVCASRADQSPQRSIKQGLAHSITTSTRSSTLFSGLSLDRSNSNSNQSAAMSQPMTPSASEWSINLPQPESPFSETDFATQDWYKLPPAEHASALTLQTLKALPDDSAPTPTKTSNTFFSPASKRVEAWNEGVDTTKSALEELCEEMGYLGSIIQ